MDQITQDFDYDGGRRVRAFVPSGGTPEAVLFSGDGQLISQWAEDLQRTDLPRTLLVAVDHARADLDRLHEYSLGFAPERFSAHEQFFLEEVHGWTSRRLSVRLPAERTGVLGVSASGEFALAMAMRHPEIYGVAMCASPGGGYRPPIQLPSPVPRAYLVAGTGEPFFLRNARRWAAALGGAGAEVVMVERAGTHGDPFWRAELPRMIGWAFGGLSRPRALRD